MKWDFEVELYNLLVDSMRMKEDNNKKREKSCINIHDNEMDLFYVEEKFWYIEGWKCLMWYCTLVRVLQY
jgi:hypothetical protein